MTRFDLRRTFTRTLVFMATIPFAAYAQVRTANQPIASGVMTANDRPRQYRVELDSTDVGWEIVLQTTSPLAADLDLYIYRGESSAPRRRPLCSSEEVDEREVCRLVPVPGGPLTIELVPNGGDGRTNFNLTRRRLVGPRMGRTSFVAGDAYPLRPGAWQGNVPRPTEAGSGSLWADAPDGRLFAIEPSSQLRGDRILAATASDPGANLELRVFHPDGKQVDSTTAGSAYQDVLLRNNPGPSSSFVLVTSRGGSLPRTLTVGIFSLDSSVPIPVTVDEWAASGQSSRSFELKLMERQSAVIELESTSARLTVADALGRAEVQPRFGGEQQLAWIGAPLGRSRHVLKSVDESRTIRVSIEATDSGGFSRANRWTLHIHALRDQPNYLVRLAVETATVWRDWWSNAVAIRTDSVGAEGVRIIALQPPPDLERLTAVQSFRSPRSAEAPAVYLARLDSKRAFHLAVCTAEGRVLDIAAQSAVRWEWSLGTGPLYLVVFPNPNDDDQSGGTFRVEVTRSISSKGK